MSLNNVVEEKISDAILKNRAGEIIVQPGFDGEYGKPLFSKKTEDNVKIEIEKPKIIQKGLGDF